MDDPDRNRIVPPSLCTKCGTCLAACPADAIFVDSFGFPHINEETCTECSTCRRVCPGWGVNFSQIEEELGMNGDNNPYLGNYGSTHIGQASDETLRDNASSGGVVSALLIHAFEEDLIEAALVVGSHPESPWQAHPKIVRSKEDVAATQQSKYSSSFVNEPLKGLQDVERLAVVGKPCDIQGIRLLEQTNPEIRDKIRYHIGIFCGFGHTLPQGCDFLLSKMGLRRDDVAEFKFRDGPYPGGLSITKKGGKRVWIPKDEYKLWNPLFMLPRCIYCIDFAAELADISVGDAFSLAPDKTGWSTMITRTSQGRDLVQSAVQKNVLNVKNISPEAIIKSQKFMARFKKDGAFARLQASNTRTQISYVTETKGVRENSHLFSLKHRLLHIVFQLRFIPISFFQLLPFTVFRRSSKILKRE